MHRPGKARSSVVASEKDGRTSGRFRHKNVIPMVANGGKMQTKGEQRRRKGFVPFHRNLLNSFD
jgi:hypothetical protein